MNYNTEHVDEVPVPLSAFTYELYTLILVVVAVIAILANVCTGLAAIAAPAQDLAFTQVSMLEEISAQMR